MVCPNKKRNLLPNPQDQQQQSQQQPLKIRAPSNSPSPCWIRMDFSCPRTLSYIEEFFRPVVRDTTERQLKAYCDLSQSSSSSKQVRDRTEEDEVLGAGSSSGTMKLKLCLMNKIPSTIYTINQIEAKNGQPLQVALWDITTNHYYNIEGTNPLSSAAIEFVVLDGEFRSDLRDQDPGIHWSEAEFNKSIVTQNVGERPLLVGKGRTTRLINGVAFVNGLIFTANSSRTRTKMVRLGVRIIDPQILNNFPRIGEAISNPFRVKDQRGESIKKNHPPKGDDEVYRLEGIGKDRYKRLAAAGIQTVDDFVKAYQDNPHSLRELMGKQGKRVSDKQWNELVKHVSEYVPLIPKTFDPNSQLNNQTIMNPTSYNNSYNMFGGTFEDHHIFQELLTHVGEASTSNYHHDEVGNSNLFDQPFQQSWPRHET